MSASNVTTGAREGTKAQIEAGIAAVLADRSTDELRAARGRVARSTAIDAATVAAAATIAVRYRSKLAAAVTVAAAANAVLGRFVARRIDLVIDERNPYAGTL